MKKIAPLILCLLLAGCSDSDWNRLLNYGGEEETPVTPVTSVSQASADQAATTAAAGPVLPANDGFCRGVAAQDATSNGFDQATQQRVYQRSYAQCVAIYTR